MMGNDKKQKKFKELIMNGYQTEGDANKMTTNIVEINSDTTTKSQQQRRKLLNVQNTQISINENSHGLSDDYTRGRRSKTNTYSIEKDPQTSTYSTQGSGYTEEVGNSKKLPNLRNISPTGLCDFRLSNLSIYKQHYSQMSVIEKIRSWKCEEEISDVEDVGTFEKDYEDFETQKKQHIRQMMENSNIKNYESPKFIGKEEFKNYDFYEFQQRIMQQLQSKPNKIRKLNRGEFLISTSKAKRKKSSSALVSNNNAQKQNYNDQNGEESDLDKIIKFNKLVNNKSSIDANSREILKESKERSMISNKQNLDQVRTNPFGDLSVFHKNNDCKHNALETKELASMFKLHKFSPPKLPISNVPKWKYPSKYNEEAENRLIQVHLDFENCKKDMNLVNKKKELFNSNDTISSNCNEKCTETSTLTKNTISAATITLTKQDSSELSKLNTPIFYGDCQHHQQQINSNGRKNLQAGQDTTKITEDKGVCHQQHEFCNYLGLTGMSTATAMANAVAELSQSNLTRRSLRVIRQQQKCQQKTIYTNDNQELQGLKDKQLHGIKKTAIDQNDRQQVSENTDNQSSLNVAKLEAKSMQLDLNTSPQKISYTTVKPSVPLKRQTSLQLDGGEPRIKIVYQISASNKKEAMIKSKKCIEDIKQPLRETIEEHFNLKLSMNKQKHLFNGNTEKAETKKVETGKEKTLLPLDEDVNDDNKHKGGQKDFSDCISLEKEYLRKLQQYEIPSTSKNVMQLKRNCPWNMKINAIHNKNSKIPIDLQLLTIPQRSSHIEATIFSLPKHNENSYLHVNNQLKPHKSNIIYKELSTSASKVPIDGSNEISLFQQYQNALEESRKNQPSIFIQESIDDNCKIFKKSSVDARKSKQNITEKSENKSPEAELSVKKNKLVNPRIKKQSQMLIPEESNLIQTRAKKIKVNENESLMSSIRSQNILQKTKSFRKPESLSSIIINTANNIQGSKHGAKGKLYKSLTTVKHKKKNNLLNSITLKRLGKRLKGGKCQNIFNKDEKSDDKEVSVKLVTLTRNTVTSSENYALLTKDKENSNVDKSPKYIAQSVQTVPGDLNNGDRYGKEKVYVNVETETNDFYEFIAEGTNSFCNQPHLLNDSNLDKELIDLKENHTKETQRITRSGKQHYNNKNVVTAKTTIATGTDTPQFSKVVSFNLRNKSSSDKITETEKQNSDDINIVNKKSELAKKQNLLVNKKEKTNLHSSNQNDIRCPSNIRYDLQNKSKSSSVSFVDEKVIYKSNENVVITTPTATTTSMMTMPSTDRYDTVPTDAGCDSIEDFEEEIPSTITTTTTNSNNSIVSENLNNEKNVLLDNLKKCVKEITPLAMQHKFASKISTQSIGINTLSIEELLHESLSVETRNTASQSEMVNVHCLHWNKNNFFHLMSNPLKAEYGKVLHIYYELDYLIVIQEYLVSFWKCSRFCNLLSQTNHQNNHKGNNNINNGAINSSVPGCHINCSDNETDNINNGEKHGYIWIALGEIRHLNYDLEIKAPYSNRICVHNSMPIYVEMRCRQLQSYQRETNLISMYVNIYYFNEKLMLAKSTSIHMDTIQSAPNKVNYTTITNSLYFIMTWQEENGLNKVRSGLCKYSLTPQLDTLASIREFKSIRHKVRYLECLPDGKLIGFGDKQVTVWDYHCGDVLMNYDLGIDLGTNIGTIIYPNEMLSPSATPKSLMLLFQYRWEHNIDPIIPELLIIACTISATSPSYRIIYKYQLSSTEFNGFTESINTDEYIIIKGQNTDKEIWISCTNPGLITYIPTKDMARFYGRHSNHVIEMNDTFLNIESVTNMVMKLAAGLN